MPRKKKPIVEIVPKSQADLVPRLPGANLKAALDRLVRERVTQIMAERGAAKLPPDFLTREESYELRSRQTIFERHKWSLYFKKWGCRRCGGKMVAYMGSGHCHRCHVLLVARLAQIKRDYEREKPNPEIEQQIDQLTRRLRSAQELLGEGEK